ncbi:MAG: 6-phosphofructokinase, partial [Acidobacteriota bacterium]
WIDRSFGFATAVGEARHALRAAHAEAKGAWNGIGLVKLMGRHSGFIAAHATLASSDVNFCLVPEVDVPLDGDHGLLERVEARLRDRHHAVVVVAEGAGQEHLEGHDPQRVDASGNRRLGDIGVFLKRRLGDHLTRVDLSHTIKYIDPSYSIRSQPANAIDAEYCMALAQHAVHAAMSGRTNLVVGSWNGHYTHVPIPLAVSERKTLRAARDTWQRVLEATGQPAWATA